MKVILGALVSAASGKLGGLVASRNRGGPYLRALVVPITSMSPAAIAARTRLAQVSAAWGALTAVQKAAWSTWAQTNPITDRLGQSRILQANAAYIKINNILTLVGAANLTDPPIGADPVALTTLTLTADIGVGAFQFAFTATPLGAGLKGVIRAAVVESDGITNVENLYRVIGFTGLAQISPVDIEAEMVAAFGTLQVGWTAFIRVTVVDTATGLQSQPLDDSAVIVSTV